MKKSIIYVGNFFFPDGNAAGKRVLGNVKIINQCGYTPIVLCFQKKQEKYLEKRYIEGITVYTIPYSDGLKRLNNKKPFNAFRSILENAEKEYKISAVIMYTTMGTFDFNKKIISLCKKRSIKTVYDFCDYFDVIQKDNLFKYIIKTRDLKILRNNVLKKCDGIISISSYLKNFVKRDCPNVIIPPLSVKRCEYPENRKDKDNIVISYASYLSDKNRPVEEWKDRIDLIIDTFYGLQEKYKNDNFLLKFIGFTKEAFINMLPSELKNEYENKIDLLGSRLVFLGECENEVSQSEICSSDYTILLRDSKVSTNAGFPTKISESLSLGIPAITNLTSDIGNYVIDDKNGFIVSGPSNMGETVEKVNDIISLGSKKAYELKKNAVTESAFYYMNFVNEFNDFICELTGDINDIQ